MEQLIDIDSFLSKYYQKDEAIILGCSTGADSMCLLYHILQSSYRDNLVACYFNHNTRKQCKEEEEYLVTLGEKLGFKVEVADCDFEKIKKLYPSKSFEELAREKRYQFFDALCHIYKTDKVITAHHLDDRIETLVFNMLRGSKLTGLINMTEKSGGVLRPLLGVEKSEIYNYVHEKDIHFFEDETNKDSSYTRNYLRNDVLPLFERVHPKHKKNLSSLMEYFQEIKAHLDYEVSTFLGDNHYFSLKEYNTLSPLLQKEVIRQIFYISNNNSTIGLTESNIAEVHKFLNGKNNKTQKEIRNMKLFKDGDIIHY